MSKWTAAAAGTLFGFAAVVATSLAVLLSVSHAADRLKNPEAREKQPLPTADHAEVGYCTPQFKEVLERVLHSCGLVSAAGRRGCQPADVKTFASISDGDFNALFRPLQKRGGVILFDNGKEDLDAGSRGLIDALWADRKGARYFLIVGRASKTGTAAKNRALSHRRANSLLFHVQEQTRDPDVDKQTGLLWLGSEFAQLPPVEFCSWRNSRPEEECGDESINRSAFASWVDCRL